MFVTALALLGVLQLPPLVDLTDGTALRTAHFFSDTANWVVPGHVLQGRHPGSGRGSALKRLTDIREKGKCGTFVCLQAELPPQDGTSFGGATDWQTVPMPGFEPYAEDAGSAAAGPVSFVHFGIKDFEPAGELAELERLVLHLADRVRQGEVLYVHCWGGKGRAGLVSACLLGALHPGEVGGEEALSRVQAYCSLRNQGIGAQLKSPETAEQKQQVLDFYARRAA